MTKALSKPNTHVRPDLYRIIKHMLENGNSLNLVRGSVYLGTVLEDGFPFLLNVSDDLFGKPSYIFGRPLSSKSIDYANFHLNSNVEIYRLSHLDFEIHLADKVLKALLRWFDEVEYKKHLLLIVDDFVDILNASPEMQTMFKRVIEANNSNRFKLVVTASIPLPAEWQSYFSTNVIEEIQENTYRFKEGDKYYHFYVPVL